MRTISRRAFLGTTIGAQVTTVAKNSRADGPIYIADMHRHLFSNRLAGGDILPLRELMAQGSVSLMAWALVADVMWIRKGNRGFEQAGEPAPGAAFAYFQRELGQMKRHLSAQGVTAVSGASDVKAAVAGRPHVVLATEGSLFLEREVSRLSDVHLSGVRHLQLVHYTRNPVADFQTERAEHGGLTGLGRDVVSECNRLGILIDVAHCSEPAVDAVLEASKVPVIWSHSSVSSGPTPRWNMIGWRARQLTLETARRIARKGGVIGLWSFRLDAGQSVETYADRMLTLADQLGEDHVAFGSDATGIATDHDFALLNDYSNLRRVVDFWRARHVPEGRIRKLAIGNYARALVSALS